MTNIKLTRCKISIHMADNSKVYTNAWCHGDLAWHKDFNKWALTHVLSGYRIVSFYGKYKDIRSITNELKDIIDWSIINHETILQLIFGDNGKVAQQIKTIIEKYNS